VANQRRLGKKLSDFRQNSPQPDRCPNVLFLVELVVPGKNVSAVRRNAGEVCQTTAANAATTHRMMTILRHLKCNSANTANMIGTVTSAVRDTTTKAMLTNKAKAMAVSSRANAIRFARSSMMIG
jgi:hypothetical protein